MRYLLLTLLSLNLYASELPCNGEFHFETIENIKISLTPKCGLNIGDVNSHSTDRERNYTFAKDGFFMVFYGTNDYERLSQSTGSSTFHLFPYQNKEVVKIEEFDDGIRIFTPSNHVVYIDYDGLKLTFVEGFDLEYGEMDHIDEIMKKDGDFEIYPWDDFLVMRHGFRKGSVAYAKMHLKTKILYQAGECKVLNNELFKVDPNDSDERISLYSSIDELSGLIKKKSCPELNRI